MHLTAAELEAGLEHVLASPADCGSVDLIVRRPRAGTRELLEAASLDLVEGLVGDNWRTRGSRSTPDRRAHPEKQVTVMNARVARLVAGDRDRMALAGDQIYVDLELGVDNLPAGSLLAVGTAVLEVTAAPHTGCRKFVERFGAEAMRFVNSREGRRHRLRGMNTRVVVPGELRVGDVVTRTALVPRQASRPAVPAVPVGA